MADYQLGWASQPEVSHLLVVNNKNYQISRISERLLLKLQRKFEFSFDLRSFDFLESNSAVKIYTNIAVTKGLILY